MTNTELRIEPSQAWDSMQRKTFIVAAFAIVVGLFSFSTAPVILTAIGEELNFSIEKANLLRIVPPAASLLTVFIAGALGDVFGGKKVLLGGGFLYCLGIVIVIAGHSFGAIVAGRALEGIGAMLLRVLSLALVAAAFPLHAQRAIAFSGFAAVSPITQIVGPSLAAPLAGLAGWRMVVAMWLLLGVLFLLVSAKLLPHDENKNKNMEFGTPILAGLVLVLISSSISSFQGSSQAGIVILIAAAIAIGALAMMIRYLKSPSFDLTLPTQPGALFVLIAIASANAADPIFFTGLFLSKKYDLMIAITSLALIPMNIGAAIGSAIGGPIMARIGPYKAIISGYLISAAIALTVIFIKPDTHIAVIISVMSSFMLFKMIGTPALMTTVMGLVPAQFAGVASSWRNASQILGVAIGGVLVGSLVFNTFHESLATTLDQTALTSAKAKEIAGLIRQGNREQITVDPRMIPQQELVTLIAPDGHVVESAQVMAYRTLGPAMAAGNLISCFALWMSKRTQAAAQRTKANN